MFRKGFRNPSQAFARQRNRLVKKATLKKEETAVATPDPRVVTTDPLNFRKRLDRLENNEKEIVSEVKAFHNTKPVVDTETSKKLSDLSDTVQKLTLLIQHHEENMKKTNMFIDDIKQKVEILELSQFENVWCFGRAKKNLYLFNEDYLCNTDQMIQENEKVLLNYPVIESSNVVWVQCRRLFENGLVETYWVKLVENGENNFTDFNFQ